MRETGGRNAHLHGRQPKPGHFSRKREIEFVPPVRKTQYFSIICLKSEDLDSIDRISSRAILDPGGTTYWT